MDRENTPEEDRLFKVLFSLYEKFEDDGKAIVSGFGKLLKDAKIPQHSYVANYLRKIGIVSCVKDGRKWLTFWNDGSRPTPKKVQAWLEGAKSHANGKKRPVDVGSSFADVGESIKKTADALSTNGLWVEEAGEIDPNALEVIRLSFELKIAHEETEMHKKQCLDALDRNNELQIIIKDQAEQILIFQNSNHKLKDELHDSQEEINLGIEKDLKIEKLKKIIKQLIKVL